MKYFLKDGIETVFWNQVRKCLLDDANYVRKAAAAFLREVMPKCLELQDFVANNWHDDVIANVADTPGEYRLPGVLLLGQLATEQVVLNLLREQCAHVALKLVLTLEENALLRIAAARSLASFAKHMPDVLITDNIITIALRLALRPDCGAELYSSCVELFIIAVENTESVALLSRLLAVKARTSQGARSLPVKLVKRIVYRLDFLVANTLGDASELSRYDLTRVLPATSNVTPEAVDVRSTVERLLDKCPRLGVS